MANKKYIIQEETSLGSKERFYKQMLRKKSFFVEESMKSSAGFLPPFYGDIRPLISDPIFLEFIAEEFAKVIEIIKPDYIAACSISGDAWATALSLKSRIPLIIIRKEPHFHGRKTSIVGEIPKKDKNLLLLEDAIASAGQLGLFASNLENEGYKISHALAFFNMLSLPPANESQKKVAKKHDMVIHYLYSFAQYLEYILQENLITKEYHDLIVDWMKDPTSWKEGGSKWDDYYTYKSQGKIWMKYL